MVLVIAILEIPLRINRVVVVDRVNIQFKGKNKFMLKNLGLFVPKVKKMTEDL